MGQYLKMILSALVCSLVCMGMVSLAGGETRQYITTGKGVIAKADMAEAKAKAVDNALETAVQSAAVSLVLPGPLFRKLDSFYDYILDQKEKFILSYKVLVEMEHDQLFLVEVESSVNLDMLKEELTRTGIFQDAVSQSRVLVLMAEQGVDDLLPKYWWGKYPGLYESMADALIRKRMEKGQFQVLPVQGNFFVPGDLGIEFSSIYDEQAAIKLGQALGVSLVILGQTRAVKSSNRAEDTAVFEAFIDFSVYDPANGNRIFTDSFQATAGHGPGEKKGTKAIKRAALGASDKMVEVCRKFFVRDMKRETHFDLTVQGENFLPRFLALKQKLMDIPGVVRVQPLQMGASRAVIDMIYQGSVRKFADQIMLITFPEFGMELVDLMENSIDIHFVEK